MAGDHTSILVDSAKAYIRAHMTGMASLYEGEIEGHVSGLVQAQIAALTASNLEISAKVKVKR